MSGQVIPIYPNRCFDWGKYKWEEITWRTSWKRPNLSSDSKDEPEEIRQKGGEVLPAQKIQFAKAKRQERRWRIQGIGSDKKQTSYDQNSQSARTAHLEALGLDSLNWNPSPATYKLCDLGQDMSFHCVSVSISSILVCSGCYNRIS